MSKRDTKVQDEIPQSGFVTHPFRLVYILIYLNGNMDKKCNMFKNQIVTNSIRKLVVEVHKTIYS